MKPTYRKSLAGSLLTGSYLTLSLSFSQTRIAKLKSNYNMLIIGPKIWDVKPTYKKSWAGNLLMWSDLTSDACFKAK